LSCELVTRFPFPSTGARMPPPGFRPAGGAGTGARKRQRLRQDGGSAPVRDEGGKATSDPRCPA